MKRFIAIILSMILVFTMVPVVSLSAFADYLPDEDFTFEDGVLTIREGVTEIPQYAFCMDDEIVSVVIPNTVEIIRVGAFSDCVSLTSVNIPDSVKVIELNAFEGCTSLESVVVGNGVESIGTCAFADDSALVNLTLGSSLKTIGDYAFSSCSSLVSVTIPESVETFGYGSFDDCTSLSSFYVPKNVTNMRSDVVDGCTNVTAITVDKDNQSYTSIDGVLYTKDAKTLMRVPEGRTGSFTIPNGVTNVSDGSFWHTNLTSVTFPDSVTDLTRFTFCGSKNFKQLHLEAT